MERRVGEALRAVRQGDKADPRFRPLDALALVTGRSVDVAAAEGDALNVSRLARCLMDILKELRLTPTTADRPAGGIDALTEWLEELKNPEVVTPLGTPPPLPWEADSARDSAG
ncbi:hypothetical protein [Streptomyces sp. NPDC090025]|uniref:hypothetical protein n=1 Tax=Streptomyces sp. NPDC090025 TaxID=3365922 RepID=UPI003832635D